MRLDALNANELFEFPSSDETPPLTHLTYDVDAFIARLGGGDGARLLPPSAVAALIRELAEKETALTPAKCSLLLGGGGAPSSCCWLFS